MEEFNIEKFFITDNWLQDAYEHAQDNGEIEPILEPLEQAANMQMEDGNYVGVYGNLDDTRVVEGTGSRGQELYGEVMESSESMGIEEVEGYLGGEVAF